MMNLPAHSLSIALMQPQIAPNTGNIARLCVATGAELHLVRPMGFILSDAKLRRSAMDYWPRLKLTVHDDSAAFFQWLSRAGKEFWLFSSKATRSIWDTRIRSDDCLIFGNETEGLSESLRREHADRVLRIPQAPGERCLNLSTAAGVAVYESLRQIRRTV
jgi:tRNA (cytidine/uridine-2'-O-)-methyltransferase